MLYRLLPLLLLLTLSLPLSTLQAEEAGGKAVHYVRIKDRIVVNIQDGERMRFMQVRVQVKSRDESAAEAIEENLPAFSDAMILLLSSQDAATMRDVQSREKVRKQARAELQKVLKEVAGIDRGIEAVYFTDFVIQ